MFRPTSLNIGEKKYMVGSFASLLCEYHLYMIKCIDLKPHVCQFIAIRQVRTRRDAVFPGIRRKLSLIARYVSDFRQIPRSGEQKNKNLSKKIRRTESKLVLVLDSSWSFEPDLHRRRINRSVKFRRGK